MKLSIVKLKLIAYFLILIQFCHCQSKFYLNFKQKSGLIKMKLVCRSFIVNECVLVVQVFVVLAF